MPASFWKLTALVGVLGLGCLIVLQAQSGMSNRVSEEPDVSLFQDLDQSLGNEASRSASLLVDSNPTVSTGERASLPATIAEGTQPAESELPFDVPWPSANSGFPLETTLFADGLGEAERSGSIDESEPTLAVRPEHEDVPDLLSQASQAVMMSAEDGQSTDLFEEDQMTTTVTTDMVTEGSPTRDLLLAGATLPDNPWYQSAGRSNDAPAANTSGTTETTPARLRTMPPQFGSPALLPVPMEEDGQTSATGEIEPVPTVSTGPTLSFPPREGRSSALDNPTVVEAAGGSAGPTIMASAVEEIPATQGGNDPPPNPFGGSSGGSPTISFPPRTMSIPPAAGSAASDPFATSAGNPFQAGAGTTTSTGSSASGGTTGAEPTSGSSIPGSSIPGSSIPAQTNPFGANPFAGTPSTEQPAGGNPSTPGRATLDEPTPAPQPVQRAPIVFPAISNPSPLPAVDNPSAPAVGPSPATFPGLTIPPGQSTTEIPVAEPTLIPSRSADLSGSSPAPGPLYPERFSNEIPGMNSIPAEGGSPFVGDATVEGAYTPSHQPEISIEKVAPPRAVVGEPLIYEIRVRNIGRSAAHQVIVEDRIPRGSTLNGTIPRAEWIDNRLLWRLGTMQPGEEQVIKVRVIPTGAGEIGSVATVSFRAEVAATTIVTAPELSVDLTGPVEMAMGEEGSYRFTIRNRGDGEARDVVVVALLPDALAHPGGRELEYAVGNIPPGEERTAELILTAASSGNVRPVAQVTVGGHVHDETQYEINLLESRLQIRRNGPVRRFVGRPATYSNVVTNLSSQPLSNVVLVETIPVGIDLASIPEGGRFDPVQRTITWTIPQLEPHQSREFRSSIVAAQEGNWQGGLVAHDASGNRAQLQTRIDVAGFSSLLVDVEHAGRPVLVGEQVSLRLTIRNGGTAAARQVQAVIQVPQELEFVTAQGPVPFTIEGKTISFQAVDSVAISGQESFDIVLTAARRGDARVRLSLSSSDLTEPIIQEQSVRIFDEE